MPGKGQSKKGKANPDKKSVEERRKVRDGSKQPMKLNKDPGIPRLSVAKGKLLQQVKHREKRLGLESKRQRDERQKEKMEQRRAALGTEDQMAALARQAGRSAMVYEEEETRRVAEAPEEGLIGAMKETSKKAFYKDFRKVVEAADVVLEVLDARDPLGCRCLGVEQAIMKRDGRKKIVLVLNKIDLVPREVVEKWYTYLKHEFPTVVFKSSTQSQKSHLRQASVAPTDASEGLRTSSECLGADQLMKLLKNYCRIEDSKTSITVGVVGYPNVGKSSLINSLKRERVCKAGAMAGTTRTTQEIHLDTNIKLLDCPGIVFSSNDLDANIILRNCVDVRRLKDPFSPVELIRQRCQDAQLMELYDIPPFSDTTEFLAHIAVRKNKMRPGGTHDLEAAARSLLQDWNTGVIPFYTLPPQRMDAPGTHLGATIVSSMGPALDVGSFIDEQSSVVAMMPETGRTNWVAMAPGRSDEQEMHLGDEEEMSEDDGAPGPAGGDGMAVADSTSMTDGGSLVGVDMQRRGLKKMGRAERSYDMEDGINLQVNRNRKKSIKAQQRKMRKKSRKGMSRDNGSDDGGMFVEGGDTSNDGDNGDFAHVVAAVAEAVDDAGASGMEVY